MLGNRAGRKRITDPTRILTLANGISVFRAFLAFPIIYTLTNPRWIVITFILIIIAILSDTLDGFLARRAHEVTHIGKILDPLADAVVIISVLFFMILDPTRNLPAWFVILYIIRYLLISLTAVYLMNHTALVFGANRSGKVAITFSSLTIALFILNWPVLDLLMQILLWITTVLLVVSLFYYLRDYLKVFKEL